MILTPDQAIARYGAIVNGVWANEAEWCTTVQVPSQVNVINTLTGQPLTHLYCNKDFVEPLTGALFRAFRRNLLSQIKTFDGCFNIRDIRCMPGKISAHSYAIAIDLNAATNPLGGPGDMTPELAQCFIDAGMTWGNNFPRKDPQHFSLGF